MFVANEINKSRIHLSPKILNLNKRICKTTELKTSDSQKDYI